MITALLTFSDNRYCVKFYRFYIMSNDLMICASDVGMTFIKPERVGQLYHGNMFWLTPKRISVS